MLWKWYLVHWEITRTCHKPIVNPEWAANYVKLRNTDLQLLTSSVLYFALIWDVQKSQLLGQQIADNCTQTVRIYFKIQSNIFFITIFLITLKSVNSSPWHNNSLSWILSISRFPYSLTSLEGNHLAHQVHDCSQSYPIIR